MNRRSRMLPMVVATAALAVLATPVMAGNLAVVTILEGGTGGPVAGEPHDLRLQLLQHGVTPVNDGTLQVTATSSSGAVVHATATSVGSGEWTATLVFPDGGQWEIATSHSELETTPPMSLAVAAAATSAPAGGSWPGALVLALAAMALIGIGVVLARRGQRFPATGQGVAHPG